jgi:hypothetical protein
MEHIVKDDRDRFVFHCMMFINPFLCGLCRCPYPLYLTAQGLSDKHKPFKRRLIFKGEKLMLKIRF